MLGEAVDCLLFEKSRHRSVDEYRRIFANVLLADFGKDTPLADISAKRISEHRGRRLAAASLRRKDVGGASALGRVDQPPTRSCGISCGRRATSGRCSPWCPRSSWSGSPRIVSAGSSQTRRPDSSPRVRSRRTSSYVRSDSAASRGPRAAPPDTETELTADGGKQVGRRGAGPH